MDSGGISFSPGIGKGKCVEEMGQVSVLGVKLVVAWRVLSLLRGGVVGES